MYPLTVQADYTELRYSLRSIEKYLQVSEVVIVGDILPYWLCNVTHIELGDIKGRKQLSIRNKILVALEYTEEFLFMNDDVYLLQPPDLKYYWHGHLNSHKSEAGAKILMNELTEMGKPVKDFDGHYPIMYDKRFKEASEQFTGDCILKSMYCNYLNIEGEQIKDCKIFGAKSLPDMELTALSTGHYGLNQALPILKEMFPNKSKYEV